jgi:HPt (histidine-containing phosphotransfer) domain-containing protein
MEDKSLKLMKLETPLEKMHKLFHSANYLGATNIETRKVLEYLKYAAELEKSLIKKHLWKVFNVKKKKI